MEIEKETGEKQAPCWCTGAAFSQALLAKIPAASQGLACVCAACAAQAAILNAT
jgi:Cysteine-rich CWC